LKSKVHNPADFGCGILILWEKPISEALSIMWKLPRIRKLGGLFHASSKNAISPLESLPSKSIAAHEFYYYFTKRASSEMLGFAKTKTKFDL
jgi:hypothetical protein